MEPFTELGVVGVALGIIFFMVKYFISAMEKKDTYIQEITKTFSTTVETHLSNADVSREKEMEVLTKVLDLLDQHTTVLSNIVEYSTSINEKMERLSKDASKIKFGRRKTDVTLTTK